MEKIFKVKGFYLWERISVTMFVLFFGVCAWVDKNPYLFIPMVGPMLIFIYQQPIKYVIKENGDLWVKGLFGSSQQKAVGIYRIWYNPTAKGWNYRRRQLIIYYKSGRKQGFFSVFPENAEELIATLKERNATLDILYKNES